MSPERRRAAGSSRTTAGDRARATRFFQATDSANADYFECDVDGEFAYDHTAKRWFLFGPHHWRPDQVQHVQERALTAMRRRQQDALRVADPDARKRAVAWAMKSEDRRQIVNLLALAQSRPTIAADGSTWDTAPMFFGVENGVLDLERGILRPGCAADRITKTSRIVYDAAATCPRFDRFLVEIFRSAPEIVPWLQRVLGYCLTGLTSEQQFWIWWGGGANGKSTLLALLLHLFGGGDTGHAWAMPFPTAHWSNAVTEYQKAELVGRRLVAASEVKRRAPLHEDFLKSLTGGDRVNARQPYGRPFNFTPICKFILLCNERPIIHDLTTSMWRRMRLVPFVETFAVDETLAPMLAAEASGVLNWLLRGCLDWQRDGLRGAPAVVEDATQEYREDSDPLAEFYAERCVILAGLSTGAAELFASYCRWRDARHLPEEDRLSQKAFNQRVRERFEDISTSARKVRYGGIGLADTSLGDSSEL